MVGDIKLERECTSSNRTKVVSIACREEPAVDTKPDLCGSGDAV